MNKHVTGYIRTIKGRITKPSRQQLIASTASAGVLLVALLMLSLAHWLPAAMTDQVNIREISVSAAPPPPPPPPAVKHNTTETTVSIQVEGAGPTIKMQKIIQEVTIDKPTAPNVVLRQTQWPSLEIDWDAFDLNDLDSLPSLLTPLRVTFPKSISRRGINKVLVKLDVMIDKHGKVTLISIVKNSYPELNNEIQKLVRKSRFTPPQKKNKPVRARFIWPVEIES